MQKEEILAKSRAAGDEREQVYMDKSGWWMLVTVFVVGCVLSTIRALRGETVADFGAIMTAALAANKFYLHVKIKKDGALMIAVISAAVSVFCFVMFCLGY